MKAEICFVALFAILNIVRPDMAGECDMAGFYLELGCSPVPSSDNSTLCPAAFSCPDLHPNASMCYYRGVAYADKSPIPQNVIRNPCSQACRCLVAGGPRFECAAVDCVEVFDGDLQQCVRSYDLESCCSTANICGKDAIDSLTTCEVDGKAYKEGEAFEPQDTHKTCICTGDWNGTTDAAYCRDIDCATEIHYQNKLLDNCAPVFIGNRKGCPINFTCLTATSKVVPGLNVRGISSQCRFGNLTLAVGDEVTVEEKCTKCTCDVPPFVSCTMKSSCSK